VELVRHDPPDVVCLDDAAQIAHEPQPTGDRGAGRSGWGYQSQLNVPSPVRRSPWGWFRGSGPLRGQARARARIPDRLRQRGQIIRWQGEVFHLADQLPSARGGEGAGVGAAEVVRVRLGYD